MRITLLFIAIALMASVSVGAVELNVMDFGAVADGVTDNTAAFQKALDEAGKKPGSSVTVPPGVYLFKGSIEVPAWVTLNGTAEAPPVWNSGCGSMLHVVGGKGEKDGTPFITVNTGSIVKGLVIFYPEQVRNDIPIPYPWTISSKRSDNAAVIDCQIVNPYQMINFTWAGRHLIRGVYGQPLYRGIFIDECYDVGRIENCHLWPFFTGWLDEYKKLNEWQQEHAVAFEFSRTDWEYVLNTFCFGYGVGYKFSESKAGSANGNFVGIGADCCRRAILVEQAQGAGLLITNAELVGAWGSIDSVCLEVAQNASGKVSLTNSSFWGPIDRCVWMRSKSGQVTLNACNFRNWDASGNGRAAIEVDTGRVIVNACTFEQGDVHVRVHKNVSSAVILGNQASGGFKTHNLAKSRTILAANEPPAPPWPPGANLNYRLRFGTDPDAAYIRFFHASEKFEENPPTMRWSTDKSELILPVRSGKAYSVEFDVRVPEHALMPGSGVYLGSKLLAKIDKAGDARLKFSIPPQKDKTAVLSIRCRGWVPKDVLEGSIDGRRLGISVFNISLRAEGAPKAIFDVNAGDWVK